MTLTGSIRNLRSTKASTPTDGVSSHWMSSIATTTG